MKNKNGIAQTLEFIEWANEKIEAGKKEQNALDIKQFSWFKHQQLQYLLEDISSYELPVKLVDYNKEEVEKLATEYKAPEITVSEIIVKLATLEKDKNTKYNKHLKLVLLKTLEERIGKELELPLRLKKAA